MKTIELKTTEKIHDREWEVVLTIVKNSKINLSYFYSKKYHKDGVSLMMDWYEQEEINKDDYSLWFKKYYILFFKEKVIGVVCFDVEDRNAEIIIAVSNRYKGKGWGKVLLLMVENELKQLYSYINCMWADIYDNPVSVKLFKSCGYEYNGVDHRKYL